MCRTAYCYVLMLKGGCYVRCERENDRGYPIAAGRCELWRNHARVGFRTHGRAWFGGFPQWTINIEQRYGASNSIMAEIRWTEEANCWLRDIYDYIATDDPSSAQKVVSGIFEKVQELRSFPEIGYRYRTWERGWSQNYSLWTLPDSLSSQEAIQYRHFRCISRCTWYRSVFTMILSIAGEMEKNGTGK